MGSILLSIPRLKGTISLLSEYLSPLNADEITAISISLSSLGVPFMYEPNNNTFSTEMLFFFNRAIYFFIKLTVEAFEEALFLIPQFV